MTDATQPAPIGDNRPPLNQAEIVFANLAERHPDLNNRLEELSEASSRLPESFTTEEEIGRSAEYIKQLNACIRWANDQKKVEKAPFTEGSRAVESYFAQITKPLAEIKQRVTHMQKTFLDGKARLERKRREGEEQRARDAAVSETVEHGAGSVEAGQAIETAETAKQEARAKPADLSRTTGEFGATVSLRETWTFEMEAESPADFMVAANAAYTAYNAAIGSGKSHGQIVTVTLEAFKAHWGPTLPSLLWPLIDQPAKEKAIRAAIKNGVRQLPGVRIFKTTQPVTR